MAINAVSDPTTTDARAIVRAKVAEILDLSPAYHRLAPDQQRELFGHMLNVGEYITSGEAVPMSATLATPAATQLDDSNQQTQNQFNQATQPAFRPTAGEQFRRAGRVSGRAPGSAGPGGPGSSGSDGGAVAEAAGTEALGSAIAKVDFPRFVGGLIDGVFKAIVTTSIQQMQAYAELVKNVSKSVDDYMKDNVTPDSARSYLADRYPDHIEMDTSGHTPTARLRQGADDSDLPDFFKDLGLDAPLDSVDDQTVEDTLVPAARRRMALDRQQLLATMVLMGINRLVVTDGHIEAACLFELKASDVVTSGTSQSGTLHVESAHDSGTGGIASWFSPQAHDTSSANFDVTTTSTNDSEAKSKLHVNLTGKVRVNFRSDTVPLERIADIIQVREIQSKAPVAKPAAAPLPPVTAPAAPVPAAAPAR